MTGVEIHARFQSADATLHSGEGVTYVSTKNAGVFAILTSPFSRRRGAIFLVLLAGRADADLGVALLLVDFVRAILECNG
jgi:hypothetical protein